MTGRSPREDTFTQPVRLAIACLPALPCFVVLLLCSRLVVVPLGPHLQAHSLSGFLREVFCLKKRMATRGRGRPAERGPSSGAEELTEVPADGEAVGLSSLFLSLSLSGGDLS